MDGTSYTPLIRSRIRRTAAASGLSLDPADVDDLVQDALLRLWEGRTEPERLYGYLGCVARNVTVDFLRRGWAKKRAHTAVPLHDEICEARPDPNPETRTILRDASLRRMRLWRRCLQSRRSFEVVYLLAVGGLSSREAATVLGMSTTAIDSCFHRAKRRLAAQGIALSRA